MEPLLTDEPDFGALIARAREGDREAMARLVEGTQDRLYRLCLVLCRSDTEAQDLAQDTYVRALTKLDKLADPTAFLPWLHSIARHLFIDGKRGGKNARHSALEGVPESRLGSSPASSTEAAAEMRELLARLKPDDRFLLLLVELEGYSYAEAAQSLGITEEAVRSRLRRLRKSLESNGNVG